MTGPALYIQPSDDRRTVSPVPWELLLDPRLKPMTKLVAAVLWGHMDPTGECRPGQEELARIAGVSIPTVKRAIRQLKRTLWIEVQVRSRGAVKLPSIYRARHPIHGPARRPRVPEQMALTLVSLQHGPKVVRGSPVTPAGITGDTSAGITHDPLTTAVTAEQRGGLRQDQQTAPDQQGWERGGTKWQALMTSLQAAHVPLPKPRRRRDGER